MFLHYETVSKKSVFKATKLLKNIEIHHIPVLFVKSFFRQT